VICVYLKKRFKYGCETANHIGASESKAAAIAGISVKVITDEKKNKIKKR
jgi:hypothetical protein